MSDEMDLGCCEFINPDGIRCRHERNSKGDWVTIQLDEKGADEAEPTDESAEPNEHKE